MTSSVFLNNLASSAATSCRLVTQASARASRAPLGDRGLGRSSVPASPRRTERLLASQQRNAAGTFVGGESQAGVDAALKLCGERLPGGTGRGLAIQLERPAVGRGDARPDDALRW